MPQPTFPSLSPSVKCAFRWVRDPALLTDWTAQCKDECSYPINTPVDRLPPFQIYATSAAQFGQATPTAWGIYDQAGNLVLDLTADIGLLEVVQFANPSREYIIYSGTPLSVDLPAGEFYSRITSAAGIYYSEPFKPTCTGNVDIGLTPTLVDWGGLVLSFIAEGPPTEDGETNGDRIASLDGSIWTWNGSAWIESDPTGDQWYATGLDGEWYQYVEGEFVVSDDPEERPVYSTMDGYCWGGSVGITMQWEFTVEQEVDISATFTHTGGSALQLKLNGSTVATFSDNETETYTNTIDAVPGDILALDPVSGSASGCLTLSLKADQNVDQCWKRLTWTNPCNLGTQYYDGGFVNILYLDNRTLIIQPSAEITEEQEEEGDGEEVMTFARKRVTYTIDMGLIPWWLADALSEAALHRTVRLEGDDLVNFATTNTWGETETCKVRTVLNFSLQEDTVQSNCCSPWDPPCLTPCFTVRGVFPDADGVGHYVLPNGPTVRYYDGEGFGQGIACPSRLVTGSNGYPDSYFDGDQWIPVAELVPEMLAQCNAVTIEASVMPRYYGQLQYSLNGTDYIDLPGGSYSASEWGDGVSVTIPSDAVSVRIRVFVGTNCAMGISPAIPVDCVCPTVTITGAGTELVNGTWTKITSALYQNDANPQLIMNFVEDSGGLWDIQNPTLGVAYYANFTASGGVLVPLPDLSTPWSIPDGFIGVGPVPTVLCS